MKKINDILTHIETLPEFKKFNTIKSIAKFIDILPAKLKNGIKFAYVKNRTLFFVLTHQVYKMEFKYNKEEIKNLLEKYQFDDISDIDFFVTNNINVEKNKKIEDTKYEERSLGIFENKVKDEKLFSKFENIRKIIKESRNI